MEQIAKPLLQEDKTIKVTHVYLQDGQTIQNIMEDVLKSVLKRRIEEN